MSHFDLYKSFFEATPHPCILVNADTPLFTIQAINRCFIEISKNTESDLLGNNFIDIIPSFDLNEIESVKEMLVMSLHETVRSGSVNTLDKYIFHFKQDTKEPQLKYSIKCIPLKDSNGNVNFICIQWEVIQNIEDVVNRANSEKQYKYLFENNPAPMFIWDFETKIIVDCNEAALIFYKYSRSEFIGLSILDIRPVEDIPAIINATSSVEIYNNVFDTMHNNVWRHLTKYGEILKVEIDGHILMYRGRKSSLVLIQDVTERENLLTELKKRERELSESNLRYNYATKATNDAIWDYDFVNNKLIWSSGFDNLFGYNPETVNLDLEFFLSCIHKNDKTRISEKLNKLINDSDNDYWSEEYRFKKANGEFAYVIDRAILIRDNDGKVIRMIGATNDISKQKEFEASLQELNNNLNQKAKELYISNKELEQFAYIASHDLQEPLRMITSFLTRLEKKYNHLLDEKAHLYIHFAVDGARRMKQIILDLLEYSRIGRIDFPKEIINLDELLQEVLLLLKRPIDESNAIITHDKLPSVYLHKSPIRQIFQNLIDNALKYRKNGISSLIHISVNETNSHFEFCIQDNGIGIESEFFDKIFIIFHRLHGKEEYSGTGMGLAISKKIVESLGGKIWIESKIGEGSKFYFTLPKNKNQEITV